MNTFSSSWEKDQLHQQHLQPQGQQLNQDEKFDPSFARDDESFDEVTTAVVAQQKRDYEDEGKDDDRNPGGGGGHKPLSGTKRALQNRKAQRAFRQRKDKYVKDLETKANEVEHLKQQLDQLRNENMELRDYTLALQSRLIEVSPGDVEGGIPVPPVVFKRD